MRVRGQPPAVALRMYLTGRSAPGNAVADELPAEAAPALGRRAKALAEAALGHKRRRTGDVVARDPALERARDDGRDGALVGRRRRGRLLVEEREPVGERHARRGREGWRSPAKREGCAQGRAARVSSMPRREGSCNGEEARASKRAVRTHMLRCSTGGEESEGGRRAEGRRGLDGRVMPGRAVASNNGQLQGGTHWQLATDRVPGRTAGSEGERGAVLRRTDSLGSMSGGRG